MDAIFRGLLLLGTLSSIGATVRTPNFVINAPTQEFAQRVADAAEVYRRELAIEWLGKPLPGNWEHPCPVTVVVGAMGAGGKTTFNFQDGHVYGWKMEVKGSEQRILDSVLPHEINHTIFASHFRRPLPRWADEGAASLIEDESERNQLRHIHSRVMGTRRKIALKTLLEIKQYPQDQQELLTLYAEGHSLADYLIQRAGKQEYIRLMTLANETKWDAALKAVYGYRSIDALEQEWDQWVMAGSQKLPKDIQIASTGRNSEQAIIRGQSPDGVVAKLGQPVRMTAADRPQTKDKEVAVASASDEPLSRVSLQQPVLTVEQ